MSRSARRRPLGRLAAGGLEPGDVSTPQGRSRERYRRATLTSLTTIGARGIAAVTALITVPLTLSYLGPERYGLWMTISSLISFLIFTDLGIGNGLLTAIAGSVGRRDERGAARFAASGVWMLGAVAFLLVLVLMGTYPLVDWASVFNVSESRARAEAGPAMIVFGLCFAAALPLTAVSQVRYALQEGYVNSMFVAAGNVLGLAFILLAIVLKLGLPILVLALMGAPLLASVANAVLLFGRQRRWLMPRLSLVDAPTALTLLRSGSQFLVLQLAMAAAFYSDSLIAARIVGPQAVAEYAVATKLFLVPAVLVTAALAPLWPAYGEAIANGDADWVRVTLRRSLVIALAISVPSSLALTVLAGPILRIWIGASVTPPMLLVAGIATWTVMSAVGSSVAMMLNGLHLLRVQMITAVVMAILNVGLSIFLAIELGVAGVILGTVIAYPISTLLPMVLYVPRALRELDRYGPMYAGRPPGQRLD